jgi:ribokinase
MRAVVVGSLNMDLILDVPALPARGQTLLSRSLDRRPGGKGANQAVALARLDARVEMVGAVGGDADGAALLRALQAAGVSTRFVVEQPATPTGLAVVCVDPDGDNAIVVTPGANASLDPGDVRAAAAAFHGADLLLLQLEVPLESVAVAARLGGEHGALVVLNAAPAGELPAHRVAVVDTTGAGDCFAAAFGLGLAEGRPARRAAGLASAAAALAVTRRGAQAMPSRAEVQRLAGAAGPS